MSLTTTISPRQAHPPTLLALPIEIRHLIYTHLIPTTPLLLNRLFINGPTRDSTTKFRTDGQSCTPQILRVNKQLHSEAMAEFYGHVYFQLALRKDSKMGYTFLGRSRYDWSALPGGDVFRYIKKLQITISFNHFQGDSFERVQRRNDALARLLNHCVSDSSCSLEEVLLDVEMDLSSWIPRDENAEEVLRENVSRFLEPLMSVRGLCGAKVERACMGGKAQAKRDAKLSEERKGLLRLLADEVDEIARLWMLPVSEQPLAVVA